MYVRSRSSFDLLSDPSVLSANVFWCHRLDQNSNKNIVRISAPKVFKASWKFLGLPVGFLINGITYYVTRKPQKASRKPTIQGRNPYNILTLLGLGLIKINDVSANFN